MLKSPPFAGQFPMLQSFGDHPERYASIACAGVALRGHNGVDFATPAGTPILAVQDGTVLETGHEPDGFGNYVVLGHAWGQSLYAHLAQINVAQGQAIGGGSQIGVSGNSGASTQPHLHFGLRIHPFSVADGWCGYSDPQPYLDRLTQPRGAVIGSHIVGGIHKHLELLRQWQPRLILVVDPNPDEMRHLRAACPDAVIVGRVFATDQDVEHRIRDNPEQAAQWAHDMAMGRMTDAVDYWQIANEVLQNTESLPLLNRFELERMRLAEAAGYRCALFAFSVGNPDLPEDDRTADWELVYPAIEQAERSGHIIALHQYGMPDLWGPAGLADWLIYRLEHQVLRRIPYKKVQFAVTEYGIDGLIQGPSPAGWQSFTDSRGYADQLLRSGSYTEIFSGRVLGYAVFTLGHNSPWGSYEIEGETAWILANESHRGVWADVTVSTAEMGATDGGDAVTAPGGGATTPVTPVEPAAPTEPQQPPEPAEPAEPQEPATPTEPEEGGKPVQPMIERRLSEWVDGYNMQINSIADRPDSPSGDDVYVVKDIFTTRNGSFDPSGEPGAIPQWARDAYLKPEFLEAGADHHLFAAVLDEEGNFVKDFPITYWSDGYGKLGDPEYHGYVTEKTKTSSGWANMFMAGGSSFVPERGESGPWCWAPQGASEVICGGGLPANHHISTFVVWQKLRRDQLDPGDGVVVPEKPVEPAKPTEPEQPVDPTQPVEPERPTGPQRPAEPAFERRISDWASRFNVGYSRWNQRPDKPAPEDGYVYVLKDLFTTHNGSWEPGPGLGAIPQWAREAYLKPFGAPDYFDDAGGDHHLFAAVIGPDGQLMRNKEIRYWSDGYDKLGEEDYEGYVRRQTKEKSGWINIPIGPGSSFVPERGESGPWCWAPEGAADVVCGGGMPAKEHVSTYAVWQAVKESELTGGGGGEGTEPQKPTQPVEPEKPVQPKKPTTPTAPQSVIRRVSPWAEQMNVSIKGLADRPDDPFGDVAYVVKDVFTTRNGSWEPDNQPHSVTQWARDDYLKPFGAPDYFDDAGADHHLFAAVIGLDGKLVKGADVVYWSDGFDKLNDPDYGGYVKRQTKDKSGWINIPIGPSSNFVPERGEAGPWCWAPQGASEIVCGGGLPAKQHISTFVVWQAVPLSEVVEGTNDGGQDEYNIFLPFVAGGDRTTVRPAGQAVSTTEESSDATSPPSSSPVLSGDEALRAAAWSRIGVGYDADSRLAKYARAHDLGRPVTEELTVGSNIVQAYDGGIVVLSLNDPEDIRHIGW